jgi:hypothetical protein
MAVPAHLLIVAVPAELVARAEAQDLVAAFARAADAIRGHPSAEGYWIAGAHGSAFPNGRF